ncbi:hypothetical protein GQ53DRAFT_357969 [Thozetella sp. PMI_491]|nr:hypothetical protein GQ53DRAFT_357969 [Thozetella sp. PMI_491]
MFIKPPVFPTEPIGIAVFGVFRLAGILPPWVFLHVCALGMLTRRSVWIPASKWLLWTCHWLGSLYVVLNWLLG